MHFAHGKSASISDIWGLCTMSMSSRIHGKVTQPKHVAVAGLHLPYREQETEPAVLVPVRGSGAQKSGNSAVSVESVSLGAHGE